MTEPAAAAPPDPEAWKPAWLRVLSSTSFVTSTVCLWTMALLTHAELTRNGASVTELCAMIAALLLGQATRRAYESTRPPPSPGG
jgi:hypothetical protein